MLLCPSWTFYNKNSKYFSNFSQSSLGSSNEISYPTLQNDEKNYESDQNDSILHRKQSANLMKGKMFDMLFMGRNYITPVTDFEELSVSNLEIKSSTNFCPAEKFLVRADVEPNQNEEVEVLRYLQYF